MGNGQNVKYPTKLRPCGQFDVDCFKTMVGTVVILDNPGPIALH